MAALDVEGCEIFNLGGGNEPLSIQAMIAIIEENLGSKARIQYLPQNKADMQDTSADIAKARRLLGWQPDVSPQEGLRRSVAWHRENAAWLDEVKL